MRQQFAADSDSYAAFCRGEPSYRCAVLYLHGDGEYGHKHYHQGECGESEGGTEIYGIAEPWISYRMIVDGYRLKHGSHLLGVDTEADKRCTHNGAGRADGHSLETFERQRTGNKISHVRVVLKRRSASAQGIFLEIVRNDEKSVNLAAAYAGKSLVVTFELPAYIDKFKRVERACYSARHRRMVEIDHRRRHFQGQAGFQEAQKEHGHKNRHGNHAEDIHLPRSHASDFTTNTRKESGICHFYDCQELKKFGRINYQLPDEHRG